MGATLEPVPPRLLSLCRRIALDPVDRVLPSESYMLVLSRLVPLPQARVL